MKTVKRSLAAGCLAAAGLLGMSAASAATITLTGDAVKVTITDGGVFSSLIYDPTKTGNFVPSTDYVAPGIPFEGFGVRIGTSVFQQNSNSGSWQISGTTAAAGGYDNAALWSGSTTQYTLTHLFFFDDANERVNITTTLTALSDLTNVRISRAVDPDPDNYPGGSAATANQRGIASATPPVPMSDFVGSVGNISGRPLGLFYSGPIQHNTGIVSSCCSVTDPDRYLSGGDFDSSNNDHGIGLGFSLGDLLSGQSISWTYAYVMGGSLGTIDIPGGGGGTVPLPSTLLLLALGGAAALRSRRRA